MNTAMTQPLLAWLLTYAIHSTLLLGAASLLLRARPVRPAVADVIWKCALVGGLLTATMQAAIGRAPAGSIALGSAAVPAAPLPQGTPAHEFPDGPDELSVGIASQSTPAGTVERTGPALGGLSVVALLALGWLVVATGLVLLYLGRHLVLVGRLGDRRAVPEGPLTLLLAALRREYDVTAHVHLSTSSAISSPVALGAAEICLPDAAIDELDPQQQRAMLAHELAHLARRDPQWLMFSCLVERAFFFQPLNRLARRGIQESAEYLADDWATRHAGGVPLARALVKVAEWMQASPLGVPVAGFAEERSHLTRRVARLLEQRPALTPRSAPAVLATAVAMLLGMAAFAPGVSARALNIESATRQGTMDDAVTATPAFDGTTATDTAIVRAVMARLRDEDAEVRRAAAEALGRMRHPMAIDALVGVLDDAEHDVRRSALGALSNFERGRIPAAPIRRILEDEDPEMRAQAVEILAEIRDRGSIPAIAQLVADANDDVRHSALSALEELKAPIGETLLARLLEDPSSDLREHATRLVGERRLVALVPQVVKLLDDRSADVRESAAESLAELRTDAARAALRRALTHADPRVRRVAVEFFGEVGEP